MVTPAITIEFPTATFNGVLSVTVTALPASLIEVMLDCWLGKLIGFTGPKPPAELNWNTGLKDATESSWPELTLPAAATNSLESLGETAAKVGFTPMLGALRSELGVSARMVSPPTSTCMTPPGLLGTLVLRANTAWKLAGVGGVVTTGITTGR